MLEVIAKGAATRTHSVPLLFVHGAWHAAWCWDEHFLNFFAAKGYRALACSLRGHGTSSTNKSIRTCTLADYIADIASVAQNLPSPPIVVGHSMGGFVVQKYLETHTAPAAVLLASAPRRGTLCYALRLLRRHPWIFAKTTWTGDSRLLVQTSDLVRENFFSPTTDEQVVARHTARLCAESQRIGLDTMLFLPRPSRVKTPLLVLGAQADRSVTPREVRATARAYRTSAEIFPGMGHDMMLEPGWTAVAERIDEWLCEQRL